MKRIAILAVLAFNFAALAQSASPIAVLPADKAAVEKATDNTAALQKQAQVLQEAQNKQLATLKWQFMHASTVLADAQAKAIKDLGLPSDSKFDPTSFTVTPPTPAPAATPVPSPQPRSSHDNSQAPPPSK